MTGRLTGTAVLTLTLLAGSIATSTAQASVPTWASVENATIRPGTPVVTDGAQCTSNFIYVDGDDVLIGMAAHCASTDDNSQTDGCLSGVNPVGTPVEIDGASFPGTMVYNSWVTMQSVGETDANACSYNDLALVRLDPRDHTAVNPSFQGWGGPLAISDGAFADEDTYTFGRSSLRPGFSTKQGTVVAREGGGWTYTVSTASNPGIPGDSGSGFLDERGAAMGVLSTVELFPQAGSNGVTDLKMALDYARQHTAVRPLLATGTEAFTPTGETATSPTDPAAEPTPDPTSTDSPSPTPTPAPTETVSPDGRVTRLSGQTRYDTAVAVAGTADGAEAVFITTGLSPSDALAAGPVAGQLDAALLLADANGLSSATLSEIRRLGATTAYVIGGPNAVPGVVESQLSGAGVTTVDRIAGQDRFGTAAMLSQRFGMAQTPVFIATGFGFADALAASPLAAATGGTILLTSPQGLPETTAAELRRTDPSQVIVLGGTVVVPESQLAAIEAAAGVTPSRLAGADRYATGAAATRALLEADGYDFQGVVWMASGAAFPDALAGGPAVARTTNLLVLVPPQGSVPTIVRQVVADAGATSLVVLGGQVAVTDGVVNQLVPLLAPARR